MIADPGSAAAGCERILATTAAAARLLALPLLVLWVVDLPSRSLHSWLAVGFAVAAAAQTLTYTFICHRAGVIRPWLAALDTLAVATAVWPGALLLRVTHGDAFPYPTSGMTYNYMMVAALAPGLARWPPPAAIVAGATLGMASLGNALAAEPPPPSWNILPDVVAPVAVTVLAVTIAAMLRGTASQTDLRRREAADGAAALARERERLHQAEVLRTRLLSTLEDVLASGAIPDTGLRDQLRAEVNWLRDLVTGGPHRVPRTLGAALREVVADKTSAGMKVRLELSGIDDEPVMSAARIEAVAGAVREALTNVARHAGTQAAALRAYETAGGLAVEVTDAGGGFDRSAAPGGFGLTSSIRQRITDVGGRADVHSASGQGTRVTVWVPVGARAEIPR